MYIYTYIIVKKDVLICYVVHFHRLKLASHTNFFVIRHTYPFFPGTSTPELTSIRTPELTSIRTPALLPTFYPGRFYRDEYFFEFE